ncbi:hypothetical protein MRX96_041519 [Rhipicephalus microplus]
MTHEVATVLETAAELEEAPDLTKHAKPILELVQSLLVKDIIAEASTSDAKPTELPDMHTAELRFLPLAPLTVEESGVHMTTGAIKTTPFAEAKAEVGMTTSLGIQVHETTPGLTGTELKTEPLHKEVTPISTFTTIEALAISAVETALKEAHADKFKPPKSVSASFTLLTEEPLQVTEIEAMSMEEDIEKKEKPEITEIELKPKEEAPEEIQEVSEIKQVEETVEEITEFDIKIEKLRKPEEILDITVTSEEVPQLDVTQVIEKPVELESVEKPEEKPEEVPEKKPEEQIEEKPKEKKKKKVVKKKEKPEIT